MFLNKDSTIKSAIHPVKEFQAIILAGRPRDWGGLDTLTDDTDAKRTSKLPKAALPMAGKPMIHYQLQWLEEARIQDILVLCPPNSRQEIAMQVDKYEEFSDLQIKVQVQQVPHGEGTADALRSVKDHIKLDFIVMTCDVITDLPPHHLIDLHRIHGPTVTALLYDFGKLEYMAEQKGSKDEYAQFIGIDGSKGRLVYAKAQEDVGGFMKLRTSMLRKFPNLRLYTKLRDAHVYIFKRWVMDILTSNKGISSIRKDLIHYLIQCQYSRKALERERMAELLAANPDPLEEAQLLSTTSHEFKQPSLDHTDMVSEETLPRPSVASATEPKGLSALNTEVVCAAVIARDSFCARANTVWAYGELNKQLAKNLPDKNNMGSGGDLRAKQTQIGPDSMVGESTQLGDRCSIRRSVIGKHCTLGKNIKIVNCVIMDYVVLEDNVKLDGCIISQHAKILEKVQLKDCEVGPKYIVDKETVGKGEQFTESHFLDINKA
ncbi:nucleotide-diphospho-sugar transferase [Phlyctochytrium arcticum]|nr:nucleotide-diphospho-sugar transferase [Phlyctochytrium arcticum]